METQNSVGPAIVFGAFLLLTLACSDVDVPSDVVAPSLTATHMPGGNPNKPPKGDDNNDPNIPTVFRDAGDRVHSDGGGPYETIKKKQQISSTFGELKVNETSNRSVCVGFPEAGADAQIISQGDWDDLIAASNGVVGFGQTYCGIVTMHIRDNPHSVPDMDQDPATTVPDVQNSGGKLVLKGLSDPVGSWEWRLLYDDNHTSVNGGERSNGLCIRYQDNQDGTSTWTYGTDPTLDVGSENPTACDGIDEYMNLIRVQDGVFTWVARFKMPFRYSLTR